MKRSATTAGFSHPTADAAHPHQLHSSVNKSHPPLDQVSLLVQTKSVIDKHRATVLKHANPERPNPERLPGPLPAPVGRKDLVDIHRNPENWWVTAKMDGMRFMMFITRRDCYLIDREFRFRKLRDGSWYCKEFAPEDSETLVDGELIWEDGGNQVGTVESLKFMVFDCLVWKGKNVVTEKVSLRLHYIQEMAAVCSANPKEREATRLPMFAKRMFPAGELPMLMSKLQIMPSQDGYLYQDDDSDDYTKRAATCTYSTLADGLVFMLEDADFHFKAKNSLLKWKLSHTVDVMTSVESAKASDKAGTLIVTTYYFGRDGQEVVAFADVPVEQPLWVNLVRKAREVIPGCSTVCVECAYLPQSQSWVVERGRPEKTSPNSQHTIQSTMKTIKENITHDALVEALDFSRPAVKANGTDEKKQQPPPQTQRVVIDKPIRIEPNSNARKHSLDAIVEKIKELVEEWKKEDTWELEGRIKGHISRSMFEEVLAKLSSDPSFSAKTHCVTRDLFFSGLRVTSGDKNEIIQKGRGQNVDIQVGDTPWALRIGLKNEVSVPRPADLELKAPDLVRIKERTSFTYASQGKACWAFDLTRVRQGSEYELKRQEDLAKQNNRELEWVYELEVEAMRVERLFKDSRTNVARSLLLKLLYYYLGIPNNSPLEFRLL